MTDVVCPHCNAPSGVMCTTPQGAERDDHSARTKADAVLHSAAWTEPDRAVPRFVNLREARIHAQSLAAAAIRDCASKVAENEDGRYPDVFDRRRIANYLRSMEAAHRRRAAKLESLEAGEA